MKAKIIKYEKIFVPITMEITIESEEELEYLFDAISSESNYGSELYRVLSYLLKGGH